MSATIARIRYALTGGDPVRRREIDAICARIDQENVRPLDEWDGRL